MGSVREVTGRERTDSREWTGRGTGRTDREISSGGTNMQTRAPRRGTPKLLKQRPSRVSLPER